MVTINVIKKIHRMPITNIMASVDTPMGECNTILSAYTMNNRIVLHSPIDTRSTKDSKERMSRSIQSDILFLFFLAN